MRDSTQKFPSWALWIMGLLIVLAAALLVLAIVLGVRAGQRQLEVQRRQDAAIALAAAIDLHANGDLSAALDAYKHVLQLEPENSAARDGIQNVLALMRTVGPAAPPAAGSDSGPVATAPPAAATLPASTSTNDTTIAPTPTGAPQAVTSSAEALWQAASTAFSAGRWQEAITRLVALKQTDAAYQPVQVNGMLFDAYANLATEKDNEDNLEEALTYMDKALELRPDDAALRSERELISNYLDVLTYFGADWPRAISLLRELYQTEPDYRDVAARLQEALVAYGDSLIAKADPCMAVQQYTAAVALATSPTLVVKRDEAQTGCEEGLPVAAPGVGATGAPTATRLATGAEEPASTTTPAAAPVVAAPAGGGPVRGRILYSARDVSTGRYFIGAVTLGDNSSVIALQDDATQPALRADGQRLLFRNVRNDMAGLGSVDPATGLQLRFTNYAEDGLPSWSPQGNRFVFASNREGDRLWRVYAGWADANGEVTNLSLGESPAWHPASDLIAFRGCDATGNACGIWQMNSSGADRAPLTTIQADNRPAWSPNGRYVVFMSDGRDGNPEVYRLDTGTGQVLRLTDSPTLDGLPTVSPDGRWVGFVSNRDGAWKIWYVSIDGGAAAVLIPINGDLGNWIEQGIQWVE